MQKTLEDKTKELGYSAKTAILNQEQCDTQTSPDDHDETLTIDAPLYEPDEKELHEGVKRGGHWGVHRTAIPHKKTENTEITICKSTEYRNVRNRISQS